MFTTSRIATFAFISAALLAVFLPFVSVLLCAIFVSFLLFVLASQSYLSTEIVAFPISPFNPTVPSRAPPARVVA